MRQDYPLKYQLTPDDLWESVVIFANWHQVIGLIEGALTVGTRMGQAALLDDQKPLMEALALSQCKEADEVRVFIEQMGVELRGMMDKPGEVVR